MNFLKKKFNINNNNNDKNNDDMELGSSNNNGNDNIGTSNNSFMDLPQIAVVGSQSAGKSSVLENIVGKSFLPRGSGIVTRRPCIIQLIQLPSGSQEYGEFLHIHDTNMTMTDININNNNNDDTSNTKSKNNSYKKFYDFNEITNEITKDTNLVCGNNKGLNARPINLKIYSPYVIDLTLIDLPGATRVPIGDQPEDISKQIEDMILSYISKENCIILAVSAVNSDLANSDALRLAMKCDPAGTRTIGVLTKLDLMDRGTNAKDILMGLSQDIPKLNLGYIGVVNRSQQDINENRTIQEARDYEMSYFRNHDAYVTFADKMGTQYLVEKCNKMLIQAISDTLPKITMELKELIVMKKKELEDMPVNDTKRLRMIIYSSVKSFCNHVKEILQGDQVEMDAKQLMGGARIEAIFSEIFPEDMDNIDNMSQGLLEQISLLIRNTQGLGGGLFTPDAVVKKVIKKNLISLEEPTYKCLKLVYHEMQKMLDDGISKSTQLSAYPTCREELKKNVKAMFFKHYEETKKQISLLHEMEASRINLAHKDFIGCNGIEWLRNEIAQELESFEASQGGSSSNGQTSTVAPPLPTKSPPNNSTYMSNVYNNHQYAHMSSASKGGGSTKNNNNSSPTTPRKPPTISPPQLPYTDEAEKAVLAKIQTGQQLNDEESKIMKAIMTRETNVNQPYLSPQQKNSTSLDEQMKNRKSGRYSLTVSSAIDSRLYNFVKGLNRKTQLEVILVVKLTSSYYDIIKNNMKDCIPKIINLMLVERCLNGFESSLVERLICDDDQIEKLMKVPDSIKSKRVEIEEALVMLEDAFKVLYEVENSTMNY